MLKIDLFAKIKLVKLSSADYVKQYLIIQARLANNNKIIKKLSITILLLFNIINEFLNIY